MRRKEKPGNKTKAFFNGKKRLVFEVGLLYQSYCLSQERNRFYWVPFVGRRCPLQCNIRSEMSVCQTNKFVAIKPAVPAEVVK